MRKALKTVLCVALVLALAVVIALRVLPPMNAPAQSAAATPPPGAAAAGGAPPPRPAPFKMAAQLGPTIIQGAKLGRIRLAARQTSPRARRPDRPRKGGPSPRGGPP